MMQYLIVVALILGGACLRAAPITNWVAVTGTAAGDGSKENPFDLYTGYTNLNKRTGCVDVLMIQPGTYHLASIYPSGTTRMQMSGRNSWYMVCGTTGNPEDVVLDGDGTCGFFSDGGGFHLRDVAFTNCYNAGKGGAICNSNWSNGGKIGDGSTVSNCIFRCCHSDNGGGAVYLRQAMVDNCLFEGCWVTNTYESTEHEYHAEGGGLEIRYNGGKVTRSVFRNCWVSCPVAGKSQCGGGGLCVVGDSASETIDCWIENCHVYETTAYESWAGGGIRASGTIRNTMITNCSSRLSYGAIGNSPKLVGCTVTKCQSAKSVLWRNALTDTLIENNVATNGSYVLDASSWCSPSFIGSVFRGNSAVGQVLNSGFDYRQSPACYSNCIFTLNKNTANNGGLYGIGSTPTIEIADCIFVENTPKNRGIFEIGMTTDSSGTMKGLTIRDCFFDSPKSYSSIIYSNQSGTMPILLENSTLIQGQNTATISLGDTAATVFYAANCLIYSYNRKYTEKTYFATASSMTNCVFTWDNPYGPTSKGDINLDAEYGNSECYYTQVGFRDPANGDYRPKKDSLLLDRSAHPAWVTGTTRRTMTKDLGDGTWTEKPAARVTACAGMTGIEKTFDIGVKVTRNNTQPRVVNDKIDVGCFEYRPKQGILLMAR